MGIRPSVHLVFGVDDFQDEQDPRWVEPFDDEWFQTVECPKLSAYVEQVDYLHQAMYYQTEFGPPNVFGYRVDKLPYANGCLFALAALNKEYQQPFAKVMPVVHPDSLEDRNISLSLAWKHLPPGQRYKYGFYQDTNAYREVAMQLFKFVKFKAEVDQLKLMLVWEWS